MKDLMTPEEWAAAEKRKTEFGQFGRGDFIFFQPSVKRVPLCLAAMFLPRHE